MAPKWTTWRHWKGRGSSSITPTSRAPVGAAVPSAHNESNRFCVKERREVSLAALFLFQERQTGRSILDGLLTEQANPLSRDIDSQSTPEILRLINDADTQVAPAVAAEIPQITKLVDAVVAALEN